MNLWMQSKMSVVNFSSFENKIIAAFMNKNVINTPKSISITYYGDCSYLFSRYILKNSMKRMITN